MTQESGLEEILGVGFQCRTLLLDALTHPSVSKTKGMCPFERLEFLGDRVLSLSIANWLYALYPGEPEGALAKSHSDLVQKSSLLEIAQRLHLQSYLRYDQQKGSLRLLEKILADGCEALLGAIFLDKGWTEVDRLIQRLWGPLVAKQRLCPPFNAKSSLQEWSQAQQLGMPVYRLCDRAGPDHHPLFTVRVELEGYPPFYASAGSKKEAESLAAEKFWNELKKKEQRTSK